MSESKKVTIMRAGGTASTDSIEIYPGDTVDQFCTLVAPKLGMAADGSYQLLRSDQSPITGDLYKSVKEGEKLILAQIGEGGTKYELFPVNTDYLAGELTNEQAV